ncbi:MAG: ankyrin repeat domain-containing protein, partial [Myxococcota bacterium]
APDGGRAAHVLARVGEPALLPFIKNWAAKTKTGSTPFHMIAHSKRPDAVAAALELGADIAVVDDAGMTALHFLADHGGPVAMFRALIDAGADPQQEMTGAAYGYKVRTTAIDIAKRWNDTEAIRVLGG